MPASSLPATSAIPVATGVARSAYDGCREKPDNVNVSQDGTNGLAAIKTLFLSRLRQEPLLTGASTALGVSAVIFILHALPTSLKVLTIFSALGAGYVAYRRFSFNVVMLEQQVPSPSTPQTAPPPRSSSKPTSKYRPSSFGT